MDVQKETVGNIKKLAAKLRSYNKQEADDALHDLAILEKEDRAFIPLLALEAHIEKSLGEEEKAKAFTDNLSPNVAALLSKLMKDTSQDKLKAEVGKSGKLKTVSITKADAAKILRAVLASATLI